MTKNNKTILLIILSLFLIFYFLWFRFIRERLPKDIPFSLNIFGFLILLTIILSYSIIIVRLIKPKAPNYIITYLLSKMVVIQSQILNSYAFFTDYLISENYINILFSKIFIKLIKVIKYFELFKEFNQIIFYIIIFIIPKIILVACFILDIFYFKRFEYFYKALLLGLISLLITFVFYIIAFIIEKYITFLEKNYMIEIIEDNEEENNYFYSFGTLSVHNNAYGLLPLRFFIETQIYSILFEYTPYKYTCVETWEARCEYAKKHSISIANLYMPYSNFDFISKILAKSFFEVIYIIIDLKIFFKNFAFVNTNYNVKIFTIILYLIYLICWIYILIVSLDTLPSDTFHCLWEIQDIEEPFSNLYLNHE